jgi:hypothetical protein
MVIHRPRYLKKLIDKKDNGLIKVITGIRRCGKSFLLTELYHAYLNSIGVDDLFIIELALDETKNARYRNPFELDTYIRDKIVDKDHVYYVFLDEIQSSEKVPNPYVPHGGTPVTFVDTLLGLMKIKNVDLYVTGSNSRMLSSEVLTEFRGRGDEIRVSPLSFSEYCSAYEGDRRDAWTEYFTYGGMPLVLSQKTHESRSKYLKDLFESTYIKDVLDHNDIRNDKDILDDLLDVVASSVGSLTNPARIANTFGSSKKISVNSTTIDAYLGYFIDAFIIDRAKRYDIKGRKYIGSPLKYYYTDVGLRNARLNFRQTEENHIMENIIFNELITRGFDVDVGIVEYNHIDNNNKKIRSQLEIDFIANSGNQRYYIQSALTVSDEEKRRHETSSLYRVTDSFKKIIVVKDKMIPWYDEKGILYIGIEQFLLEESAIDL